ncbi:amidase [Streptomyces sp. NPDC087440]|uniref:amidase n=1 Tax=Streptomyces sp. NPDC087440 TaxID=3365790 RepID=UPI0037F5B087
MYEDITGMDALAQADAVRGGEVSPVELVERSLAAVEKYDAPLGVFVTVTADAARRQAREAERRLREDGAQGLPPLFGVPTAIKDLTATAGVRTTFGSRAFAGHVPERDARSVELLRAAGLISVGKTNTPEFGLSSYSDNDVTRSARTPWDVSRSAGGSSGGAAAAVAAGVVPLAHGSDGGGSIRIPASSCGIFGLKPSRGRVSPGPDANVAGLTVEGPLARTVRDAAAMLDALAGPDVGDPYWAPPLGKGETFLSYARNTEPGRLRIARYADLGDTGAVIDPACRAAYEQATELLLSLGHEVEEIRNPFVAEIGEIFFVTWGVQSLRFPVAEGEEELLRPITRFWRERGRATSGEEFYRALAGQQLLTRRVLAATQQHDAVLTPTLGMLPQPPAYFTGEPGVPAEDLMQQVMRQSLFTPFTSAANVTGQPAASLPLYWTEDGLPVGVSLTGRPAGEGPLLSLCAQLEAARPWAHRRPAL